MKHGSSWGQSTCPYAFTFLLWCLFWARDQGSLTTAINSPGLNRMGVKYISNTCMATRSCCRRRSLSGLAVLFVATNAPLLPWVDRWVICRLEETVSTGHFVIVKMVLGLGSGNCLLSTGVFSLYRCQQGATHTRWNVGARHRNILIHRKLLRTKMTIQNLMCIMVTNPQVYSNVSLCHHKSTRHKRKISMKSPAFK